MRGERVDRLVSGSRKLMKHKLMVVEKVDVRDADGLHRKYSAMKIGDHLVPRHVLFSTKWITKKPDVVTAELVKEERQFLEEFPHAEQVEHAFRVAGMDYGRIDYGFSNGRMQVWEINSNPDIVPLPERVDPLRMEGQAWSADLIAQAFRSLLTEPLEGPAAPASGRRTDVVGRARPVQPVVRPPPTLIQRWRTRRLEPFDGRMKVPTHQE